MPITQRDIKKFEGCETIELHDIVSLSESELDPGTEVLILDHFHRVDTLCLDPLADLRNLRFLSLSTTTTWDGSGRTLKVDTFSHCSDLPKLEVIQILGVVPLEDRLKPLEKINSLRVVSIGNTRFYTIEDFAGLSRALPKLKGVQPLCRMNFVSRCESCKWRPLLFLQGAPPRAKAYVCSKCDHSAICRHLDAWNEADGVPSYPSPETLSPRQIRKLFPVA
jgi:hypothetical protein